MEQRGPMRRTKHIMKQGVTGRAENVVALKQSAYFYLQWVPEHTRVFVNLNAFIVHTHTHLHKTDTQCIEPNAFGLCMKLLYEIHGYIFCLLSLRHFRAWWECHSVASWFSSSSKGFCSWICQSLFFRRTAAFLHTFDLISAGKPQRAPTDSRNIFAFFSFSFFKECI